MHMKKHHLLAATLLLTLLADKAEAQYMDTLKRKDPDGWEFVQMRAGGVVNEEGYLHNGIKENVWSSYWPSGYPKTVQGYLHGKRDGVYMRVTEEGGVDVVEQYKDDKLEGPRRVYYIRGPRMEETYYSDGKKNGKYTKWYQTGIKQEEGSFNNDLHYGKSTWYYASGKKAVEYEYNNGDIDGDAVSYYENGKVSELGTYKKNIKTGSWREFYENGNTKAEGKYEDNEKEGAWKQYDENGKFVKTVRYNKGVEVKK